MGIALVALAVCGFIGYCAYIYFRAEKAFEIFENPECRKKTRRTDGGVGKE